MMDDRGVSEVLGFALVFALVASVVAIISVTGFSALEDTRSNEQVNNAERAFDVLADNVNDIYQEDAPSRATEISLSQSRLEVGDPVKFNVTVINSTGTNENLTYQFEPIVHTSAEDTEIVYAGSAVFRVPQDGGLVTERPPFLISSERVVIPIIQMRFVGDTDSVSGRTIRIRAESVLRERLESISYSNPGSQYGDVVVNVTSPRHELWAQYFEEQPDTTCTIKDESAVCTISDPDRILVSRVLIDYEYET